MSSNLPANRHYLHVCFNDVFAVVFHVRTLARVEVDRHLHRIGISGKTYRGFLTAESHVCIRLIVSAIFMP